MPGSIYNSISVHYVKFIRGSVQAWENLKLTPNKIDDDTLYFIYESIQNPKKGKLYLGQKLISGNEEFSGDININDIGDIQIDDSTLADKQILVYNETTEQWENTSLSTIINTAIGTLRTFSGATENTSGLSGIVPAPAAGDQDKFLKGDGSWAFTPIHTFDSNVFAVQNDNVTLAGYGLAANGSIPVKTSKGIKWSTSHVGTLNRQITTMEKLLAQLAGEDPDPIDENAIYMIPNGNESESSDRYNEYMVIGGQLELLGTFGQVNLTNYVTNTTFNTRVGAIENILQDTVDSNTGDTIPGLISRVTTIEENYVSKTKIGDLNALILSENNTTLVEEVNTINDRLKWHDLT